MAGGNPFDFKGMLTGDHLQFVTGGATYELDRPATGGAQNPFGAAAKAKAAAP